MSSRGFRRTIRRSERVALNMDEAADEMGVPRPSAASLRLLRGTRRDASSAVIRRG
jgi:hypothetical protein